MAAGLTKDLSTTDEEPPPYQSINYWTEAEPSVD
jgi:hypothetical protein